MTNDIGDRVTRLEVQQDATHRDLNRVEASTKEKIEKVDTDAKASLGSLNTKLWAIVMIVIAYTVGNLLGLINVVGQ